MVPANCTVRFSIQAVTLRPPLADEPLVVELEELLEEELLEEEPLDEEAVPNRLRTICSLLLAGKLSVTCCGLEPWGPTLNATCSPPPLVGAMLMVICSGLELPAAPPRVWIISGPPF